MKKSIGNTRHPAAVTAKRVDDSKDQGNYLNMLEEELRESLNAIGWDCDFNGHECYPIPNTSASACAHCDYTYDPKNELT